MGKEKTFPEKLIKGALGSIKDNILIEAFLKGVTPFGIKGRALRRQ